MSLTRKDLKKNEETDNPCLKEHRLSLKCLDDNAYDREKCEKFFMNYKTCNEFWLKIQKQRRIEGIRPLLPPVEERDQIKAQYMKAKPA